MPGFVGGLRSTVGVGSTGRLTSVGVFGVATCFVSGVWWLSTCGLGADIGVTEMIV